MIHRKFRHMIRMSFTLLLEIILIVMKIVSCKFATHSNNLTNIKIRLKILLISKSKYKETLLMSSKINLVWRIETFFKIKDNLKIFKILIKSATLRKNTNYFLKNRAKDKNFWKNIILRDNGVNIKKEVFIHWIRKHWINKSRSLEAF